MRKECLRLLNVKITLFKDIMTCILIDKWEELEVVSLIHFQVAKKNEGACYTGTVVHIYRNY
jgi:hypothetical protein